MGNEAADADSIVSSLSYAFICKQQHSDALHVPVLSIPRSELVLRCDISALLQELGVDTKALLFVDEFPWDLKTQLRVTLLDHNALSNKRVPQIEKLQVVEIVDHHSDLQQHLDAETREVAFADGSALVASTCTLVAERLALAPTDMTPRDVAAAVRLEETAFAKKEELFTWLQGEKFNPVHWGAFTLENCLQVDYKEFVFATAAGDAKKVGTSAVLIDLEAFVLKSSDAAALHEGLSAYCQQNDLTFLMVMTMFMTPDNQRHRQLLFFQETGDDAKHCVSFLKQEGSLQMEALQLPQTHQEPHIAAFNQLNTGVSRKQVVPLIQQALAAEQ
ncbi:hypothetical protein BBO99_00006757 [Phytophthora kernoviae]|uniref:DHHA2 domain-containing protein n=2 Tax=Phytophthora kernoviae TaxID=325452 RepID=A0A3R7J579_9STRA|nr:hypothetical protein G195_007586 [Phytophthora kernoviae 00238/432]KAG2521326.1 hypothetical protein JM16_006304 [Phytophthora kernoviae]KAG2522166.1 hypothetical protein JM18_006200 [Phytophthora kernoviae]RLN36889.1 hypothetical protein BBI17_006674 [Phytophthora kernoviae]RLN77431.1 hypothetical protein BBO99_00006757 [Phytophthora kernoviae]